MPYLCQTSTTSSSTRSVGRLVRSGKSAICANMEYKETSFSLICQLRIDTRRVVRDSLIRKQKHATQATIMIQHAMYKHDSVVLRARVRAW